MKVKKSKTWSHLCHAFVTLVFCGCCPDYAIFADEKRRQAALVGNKASFIHSLALSLHMKSEDRLRSLEIKRALFTHLHCLCT